MDSRYQRTIYVTFQVPGIHYYPQAKNFLGSPHRHMFHFKVTVQVAHNNRDLEFFEFREKCLEAISSFYDAYDNPPAIDFGASSCEDLCEFLLDNLPGTLEVEVSEDNENGAILRRI